MVCRQCEHYRIGQKVVICNRLTIESATVSCSAAAAVLRINPLAKCQITSYNKYIMHVVTFSAERSVDTHTKGPIISRSAKYKSGKSMRNVNKSRTMPL